MREVKPRVFHVGRTELLGGLDEYLEYIGSPDWQTDAETDGDKLVEAAGRMCYRSWQPYDPEKPDCTNPNVERVREGNGPYIANILKSGHGCYDGETEVLTSAGWVPWKNVSGKESFATLNKAGVIEYQHATGANLAKYYKGKMYRVFGNNVDLFVTPNHNMFVSKDGQEYDFIKAEDLNNSVHAYVKNGTFHAKEIVFSRDELALIGFAIGKGTLKDEMMQFRLRQERHILYLESLAEKLDLKLTCDAVCETWTLKWPYLVTITDKSGQKRIPQELLFQRFAIGLYDGLINSDLEYPNLALAGQFQQLCLHVGISANTDSDGNIQIVRRNNQPEVNKWSDTSGKTKWIDWEGLVYCVEVPNHTLYVRRNGKPVWCGNSILEHVNFNFIFAHVSRVFTHELVRHRAGMGYSQESLRYVRLENLNVWLPEILKSGGEEAVQLFKDTIGVLERAQTDMARVFGIEKMKDFNKKKALTSMFRRVAPIGLATTIMATGNARAWRHIINMRTNEHAEEEMRLVVGQVAPILKREAPSCFQDLYQNDLGEWTFKLHVKP